MRKRVILYTFIALLTQFLILSTLFTYRYRVTIKNRLKGTLQTTMNIEQGIFETFIKEKKSNIFLLSNRNGLMASLDDEVPLPTINENLTSILDSFLRSYHSFEELYLFDENFRFITAMGAQNQKDRQFYKSLIKNEYTHHTTSNEPIHIEKNEKGKIQFYIITRIYSKKSPKGKGKLVGHIALKIKDSYIENFFKIIKKQLSKLDIPEISINFDSLLKKGPEHQRFCSKIHNTILSSRMCLSTPIDNHVNNTIINELLVLLSISILMIVFMILFQINYLKKVFYPVFKTIEIFRAVSRDERPNLDLEFDFEEFGFIKEELIDILKKIKQLQEAKDHESATKALIKQSKQIHHDIRNPIEALFLTLKSIKDENKRIAMFNSVQRIKDLIDVLKQETLGMKKSSELTVHPFIDAIFSLTAQSRLLYFNRKNIKFELDVSNYDHDKFFKINYLELNRIVTNIIKNSSEALTGNQNALIRVHAYSTKDKLYVDFIDNGPGFLPNILNQIFKKEVTSKVGGQGIGLMHAFTEIKKMGAKIEIDSHPDKGCKTTLIFDHHTPPTWWCDTLHIEDDVTVFVLDDDDFLHESVDNLFKTKPIKNQVFHYKDSREFIDYYFNNFYDVKKCLFLFDYELLGQDTNGINLAVDLEIVKSTVLVTSKSNETLIQNKCLELGIKMIPKFIFSQVKVKQY